MPSIDVQVGQDPEGQGIRLRYREQGRARGPSSPMERNAQARPALLLVHGAGASSLCFAELLCLLGQQRRTVAVDLPGHGNSDPLSAQISSGQPPCEDLLDRYGDAAAALAERLGLGRFVLVGHSMGGAVAQRFAVRYGDRLAGLVLLATGARLKVGRQLREVLERRIDALPAFFAAHGFSPATPQAAAERWAPLSIEAPRAVIRADFEACDRFDQRPVLPTLSPSYRPLVIGGADDMITPPAMSRELAEAIPRARLELLPRAGHQLFLERPDATAEAILAATC